MNTMTLHQWQALEKGEWVKHSSKLSLEGKPLEGKVLRVLSTRVVVRWETGKAEEVASRTLLLAP